MNLLDAVKGHALTHYNEGGWDYVVEATTDEELAELIGDAGTVADAIERVAHIMGIVNEQRQNAIVDGGVESKEGEIAQRLMDGCDRCGGTGRLDQIITTWEQPGESYRTVECNHVDTPVFIHVTNEDYQE